MSGCQAVARVAYVFLRKSKRQPIIPSKFEILLVRTDANNLLALVFTCRESGTSSIFDSINIRLGNEEEEKQVQIRSMDRVR